jgi:Uma2 family endonuclease
MSFVPESIPTSLTGQPAWEIATLFPPQGAWSSYDYLDLTDSTNRLIELTKGQIEVLEMPTTAHQLILLFLYDALKQFVKSRDLGTVVVAALRLRLSEDTFREPDILFAHRDHPSYVQDRYWTGADLVMEIVSNDDQSRKRDLVDKRADYALAGIPEYWIVDPKEKRISVLTLDSGAYAVAGEFVAGQRAASQLLEGFAIEVQAVLDAAKGG